MMQESPISLCFQHYLLLAKLPRILPSLFVDMIPLSSYKSDGTFFEIIQIDPHTVDFFIGRPHLPMPHALTLATAIKFELLRLIKPLMKEYHYDQLSLWEQNLFSPHKIIQHIQEFFREVTAELDTSLSIFYGRFDFEEHLFTYLDCGFGKLFHLNAQTKHIQIFNTNQPALGREMRERKLATSQLMTQPGDCFILYPNDLSQTEQLTEMTAFDQGITHLIKLFSDQKGDQVIKTLAQDLESTYKAHLPQESILCFIKLNDNKHPPVKHQWMARFASDLSQLQAVRSFVRHFCLQSMGNQERLAIQLQLAVNEVFCNIVKHSYRYLPHGEIVIECQLTQEGISFTLSDKGESFNPAEARPPNLAGNQEDGFGLFIIQQIADSLSYLPKSSDNPWNHLRIFKRYFFEEDQMEFSHKIQDHLLIITPEGKNLDAKSAPAFKEGVLDLIRSTGITKLIFDLGHLQFIDSSGLGSFLSIQRALNTQSGTLKLAHLNKPVQTMFEIVSMHRIFDIFPSVEEAIRSF